MTWVIGTLARQLWAVPARTSSQSDLPFINYNMQVSFGLKAAVPAGWRHGRPTSISRRPAETAPRATARAVDATRIPHPGRGQLRQRRLPLASELQLMRLLCPSYYHAQHCTQAPRRWEHATEHDTDQNLDLFLRGRQRPARA